MNEATKVVENVPRVLASHGALGYDDVDGCECGADVRTHDDHRAHVARMLGEAGLLSVVDVQHALEVILARVRCEALHGQTQNGRCVSCISWAKRIGAPRHMSRLVAIHDGRE